jgi:propionyl-CoA carboxylase alpha chain
VQGAGGDVVFVQRPRFVLPGSGEEAGGFVARMPGKVIQLRVAAGDRVRAGDIVLVLEAMKMEHPMRAPEDGVVVELRVAVGDQVENGALLLVVEPAAAEASNDETGDS